MRRLHELPDDILIQVFGQCDVDAILAIQLTCATLSTVIRVYIRSIAPKVARQTLPGCEQILVPPSEGYSLKWLRGLIPAQLASIVLDKDKLRRCSYINSGVPYGIPSENDCEEAKYWRTRIASGWRILRSLYLISKEVYARSANDVRRPNPLRRASSSMRNSRWWQAMSCPYPGCTEHGLKQVFESEHQKTLPTSQVDTYGISDTDGLRRRESTILKTRLAYIEKLSDQDLLNYIYLWRLLLHVFRPYKSPSTSSSNLAHHASTSDGIANLKLSQTTWSSVISDISQGCSWLNWYILSIGPSPFIQQWSLIDTASSTHLVRDMIRTAYTSRTSHQIEVEREYICKFEFALRKRCLSRGRLKRLDNEVSLGRSIRTISLECIPWIYDQHYTIARPATDFPWYEPGQYVWLDDEWCVRVTPGTTWSQPGRLRYNMVRVLPGPFEQCPLDYMAGWNPDDGLDEDQDDGKGPLAKVPYLVYLGDEEVPKFSIGNSGVAVWSF